ncbi:hypothetical protein BU25DRAFT_405200 [Macroventuria anomochaeta]|uniref:Uncharacterized protein n=1 Tax=Macroventuria anomochaeta TaxID=301207 RepID=A0ACB6SGD0_9PLEO|nr:uncharacterized protein BU25DRAFT_405200 [Macroventuria anomochaeta]KAF2633286.1 hypothetical protein BU25DRAFT_405200 [Macroventuria anomochaeta]
MSHITPDVKCSSGFIGCVAYDKGSEICNGPKRFYNDCSGAPGLGSFYHCANGFVGCTTNSRICDTGSTGSVKKPDDTTDCPVDSSYYICASNGFRGCSTNPHICDPDTKPVDPVVEPVEDPSMTCPAGSSYYVCASNGFRGCSTNPHICDTATTLTYTGSAPTPSASVINGGTEE